MSDDAKTLIIDASVNRRLLIFKPPQNCTVRIAPRRSRLRDTVHDAQFKKGKGKTYYIRLPAGPELVFSYRARRLSRRDAFLLQKGVHVIQMDVPDEDSIRTGTQ